MVYATHGHHCQLQTVVNVNNNDLCAQLLTFDVLTGIVFIVVLFLHTYIFMFVTCIV